VYVEQTFATESSSVAKDLPEVFQRFAAANFVDPSEVQPDYHG
jgi:Asp-tRNA(Asn)/Glu-tRNA(Gln) amidotransferase C subunit